MRQPQNFYLKGQPPLLVFLISFQKRRNLIQHRLQTGILPQPQLQLSPVQNQRHPIVNRFYRSIRFCGQYHEVIAVLESAAAACHKDHRFSRTRKNSFLPVFVPLIKAPCQNNTSAAESALSKRGPFQNGLCPGIDPESLPVWPQESPFHLSKTLRRKHQSRISRADISRGWAVSLRIRSSDCLYCFVVNVISSTHRLTPATIYFFSLYHHNPQTRLAIKDQPEFSHKSSDDCLAAILFAGDSGIVFIL